MGSNVLVPFCILLLYATQISIAQESASSEGKTSVIQMKQNGVCGTNTNNGFVIIFLHFQVK